MNDSKFPRDFVAAYLKAVPRSGIRDFFDVVSQRKDCISLGIGEPDFVTPWHIREASIFALDRGNTSYTSNLGILELREAVTRHVGRVFKVNYDPKTECLITVGVSEALDLAIRATCEPGDEVLYHEPSYVSYPAVITFAHAKPVAITTGKHNDFRLTRAMIEKHLTPRSRVLVLNFPTNPTGAVLSREDIEGIAALARERDLLVITDEIYAELVYDGAPAASIASLPGMKERTIFLHGFSKSWAMTGFRIGFACAPPALTDAMMKIHQYTMMCAPTLSQKAALEAINNGAFDVEDMLAEYTKRRNFITDSLNEMGLPCHLPKGAFYVFPTVGQFGMTSKEFALRLLDEGKVACVPGTAFGSSGEGFLRCSYATNLEDIKEAMRRMAIFVKGLKKVRTKKR